MPEVSFFDPTSNVYRDTLPDLDLSLQPKQELLYWLLKDGSEGAPTILGYGGARGGAKSGGAQRCALALAWETPDTFIMIFRVGWSELVENHVDKIIADYPEMEKYWRANKKRFQLPNGSRIAFRYGQSIKEVRAKTRGQEYKYIFVDQAEECTDDMLEQMRTCNRAKGSKETECKMIYLFNPGGPGTEYLRRVFFMKRYEEHEHAHNYAFIQAYGWDNYQWFRSIDGLDEDSFYALPSEQRFEIFITKTDYGKKMMELPESIRMGELYGRFDIFAGQYFAGVWDEVKCVLPTSVVESVIQSWWVRWMAADWGFRHDSVNLWFTNGKMSPSELWAKLKIRSERPLDIVIVYREYSANQTAEADFAAGIVARTPREERKLIQRHFIDTMVFSEIRKVENTIAELIEPVLRAAGLPYLEASDKDRIGGWRQLYDGLRRTLSMQSANPPDEPQGGPLLFISAECPQLISSVPMLVCDPKNSEDVLKMETLADDYADTLRYGWKSMLDPNRKPVAVRAQEVYDKYQDNTSRALALMKFKIDEKSRQNLHQKRRR